MAVSVVQTANATATATSVTATFGSPVTAGNTICASVSVLDGATSGFTVALTFGSSPDNWFLHRKATRSAGGSNIYTAEWADANTAITGTSTVTVTLSGATGGFNTSIILTVYEVAGLAAAAEDITGASSGNGAGWTTGTFTPSGSTAAADEFWWGSVTFPSSVTISPPGTWTNTARLTTSIGQAAVSGYQTPGATGSPVYSGTFSANVQWACAGTTLKARSISATAALAGHGTESAAGAIGGTASPAAAGTLGATPSGGLPDTWTGAGTGTLGATPTETIEAGAALAGTGSVLAQGTPPVDIHVVNQWAGDLAQNPQFGASLPAAPTCNVPLTLAYSVGGGSGVPTPGNWLFTAVGWRQDPGIPGITISVQDDGHQWNRPSQPSSGTGLTRCTLWYQPSIGAVTGFAPAEIYVAPSGYVASMSVLVFEVTGLGAWDDQVAIAANYSGSTNSLSLTLTL